MSCLFLGGDGHLIPVCGPEALTFFCHEAWEWKYPPEMGERRNFESVIFVKICWRIAQMLEWFLWWNQLGMWISYVFFICQSTDCLFGGSGISSHALKKEDAKWNWDKVANFCFFRATLSKCSSFFFSICSCFHWKKSDWTDTCYLDLLMKMRLGQRY